MKRNKYLPKHYNEVSIPYFEGRGNLSVKQLEDLSEEFKEYTHQQAIIKQNMELELEKIKSGLKRLLNASNSLELYKCSVRISPNLISEVEKLLT